MRTAAACRIIFCIFMLILLKNVLPYLIKFVYLQRIEEASCIYQRQLAVGIELEFVCKITMQRRYWTLRGIMNLRSSGSLGLSPLTASDALRFTPPIPYLIKLPEGFIRPVRPCLRLCASCRVPAWCAQACRAFSRLVVLLSVFGAMMVYINNVRRCGCAGALRMGTVSRLYACSMNV